MKRPFHTLALYLFHISFARPLVRWVAGVRYRKRGLLPKGPCIVVSNHNSHLDAAVLMGLFPLRRLPRVHPVAAADYFGSTRFRRTTAMMLMNAIAIERRPSPGTDPLEPVAAALAAGDSLIFFPEGSRGEAGVVARFRPGIGRIVRQTPGLLVVPVFLSGPERIWPRGEMVPVPLNIDVVVGKPRSYPANEDPRVIAEQVQRDVLALAPPLPPLPGPRPEPVRVAVCGLDAEMRAALFEKIAIRLGRLGATLGISDRILEVDAEGPREVTGPIPHARRRAWLGMLAVLFRVRGRSPGRKFASMIERSQINEALSEGRAARFVVSDGSALVDLLAWASAEFYREAFDEAGLNRLMQYLAGQHKIPFGKWWRFIRKAPEVWLINELELARPPVPGVVVQINRPVPDLMRALRSRGDELGPRETEAFLERLQAGYRQVGQVLRKRHQVDLLEYDSSEVELDDVAAEVAAVVERRGREHVASVRSPGVQRVSP